MNPLFGKTCIALGIFFSMHRVYISIDIDSQLEWTAVEIDDGIIMWVLTVKFTILQFAVA